MPLSANARLGPYEIRSTLGAGGMGEVYQAFDARLNRNVAIKVLRADHAISPELRVRFEREARAIAAFNHPNIVSVYDFGVDADRQYIVSELVDGSSLRSLLTGKPVPLRKLLDIAAQTADGLAAAHAAGFVHRDLKPENIMLTKEGRVKIVDFGLARQDTQSASDSGSTLSYVPDGADSGSGTIAGVVLGTPRYMSPEQALGKPALVGESQDSVGMFTDYKLYSIPTVGGQLEFIMDAECEACDLSRDGKTFVTLAVGKDNHVFLQISDPVGSPLRPYTPAPFDSSVNAIDRNPGSLSRLTERRFFSSSLWAMRCRLYQSSQASTAFIDKTGTKAWPSSSHSADCVTRPIEGFLRASPAKLVLLQKTCGTLSCNATSIIWPIITREFSAWD